MEGPYHPEFVADYGYVADLASACGWRLGLARIEGGRRYFLRVRDADGTYLAGVKFPTSGNLDTAARALFDALSALGVV